MCFVQFRGTYVPRDEEGAEHKHHHHYHVACDEEGAEHKHHYHHHVPHNEEGAEHKHHHHHHVPRDEETAEHKHHHHYVGLSYIQTLRGYLVMGIPYMVVCLFVHLYVFVTSCAQYKHEAQFLVVHSWSQHPENPTQTRHGLLPFTTATWFMKP